MIQPRPLVGAYYYAWYERDWLRMTVRKEDPPLLGEYDNTRYGAVEEHVRMAERAGLDFFSVSYDGSKTHEHIVDAANSSKVRVTYFFESMTQSLRGKIPERVVGNAVRLMAPLRDLMAEPCWLRVGGRPVLMIYVVRAYENAPAALDAIRAAFPDAYLVGDLLWWDAPCRETLSRLDACTWYNMYQDGTGRFSRSSPEEAARTYLESSKERLLKDAAVCRALGVEVWGNAMPGYDDSGVRPERGHFPIPRKDGQFFKDSIRDAREIMAAAQDDPGVLMVTSFNEWYEDTQIESCSSYGESYLGAIRSALI